MLSLEHCQRLAVISAQKRYYNVKLTAPGWPFMKLKGISSRASLSIIYVMPNLEKHFLLMKSPKLVPTRPIDSDPSSPDGLKRCVVSDQNA